MEEASGRRAVAAFSAISRQESAERLASNDGSPTPPAARNSALQLLNIMRCRIPAYTEFLRDHGVDSENIKTFADWKEKLPALTKANYVAKYALPQRVLDGNVGALHQVHTSTGSTGTPTIW
eukprot:TRINITY_DN1953_c0_g1_i1.p1 TRINITY_DN1953_c0_g1~~TRINITY_DN1953_c0_g1_i1.p1  ORF type:complete len:122 (-),score=23.59 TRINITY_DN1953_c0_g1_i1:192-557(-)